MTKQDDSGKRPLSSEELQTLVDTAIEQSKEQLELRRQMREAIEQGDLRRQYALARQIVGLPPEDQ